MNRTIYLWSSLIIGLAAISAVLAVGYYFLAGPSKVAAVRAAQEAQTKRVSPIIQINTAMVSVIDEKGAVIRTLDNGDVLVAPIRLKLSNRADATIIYPDGSSARLSPSAIISLDAASYDPQSGAITSKIYLILGHVWSKVIALATPESQWQVETPHAVATVRGTVFDAGVVGATSTFTGSEHNVSIVPFDPDTKEEMSDKAAMLSESKRIVLGDKTNRDMKTSSSTITMTTVTDKSDTEAQRQWFKQNENRDQLVDELKQKVDRGESLDNSLRNALMDEQRKFEDMQQLKEMTLTSDTKIDIRSDRPDTKQPSVDTKNPDTKKPQDDTVKPTEPKKPELKPKEDADEVTKVTVSMKIPVPLVEQTQVPFTIQAVLASGQTRDITAQAKVSALGGIGKIIRPGQFLAELAPEVSELGQADGVLAGTWVDPKTGKVYNFRSELFTVEMFIEETTDLRG